MHLIQLGYGEQTRLARRNGAFTSQLESESTTPAMGPLPVNGGTSLYCRSDRPVSVDANLELS